MMPDPSRREMARGDPPVRTGYLIWHDMRVDTVETTTIGISAARKVTIHDLPSPLS